MKIGVRKQIVCQLNKALKEPKQASVILLMMRLAEAEGPEGYWHDVLIGYTSKGTVLKEPEESGTSTIDPFDRGKK